MLVGRDAEQARIRRLMEGARAGSGGGLLVLGEPGIGKTALLDDAAAAAAADRFRVLRATGMEIETELPYSGLFELLRPVAAGIAELPPRQAAALRAAFAEEAAEDVDGFAVAAAALTLLSEASVGVPVLCLIDDAQWLDGASMVALGFTVRRIESERVAMVFAAREQHPGSDQHRDEFVPESEDRRGTPDSRLSQARRHVPDPARRTVGPRTSGTGCRESRRGFPDASRVAAFVASWVSPAIDRTPDQTPTRKISMNVLNRTVLTIAATLSFGIAAPAIASADTPANDFATNYSGCLGPLRSAIASGALDGATLPDGTVLPGGFGGSFNPGDHLGTVAEAEFLMSHGFTEQQLAAFCASLATH